MNQIEYPTMKFNSMQQFMRKEYLVNIVRSLLLIALNISQMHNTAGHDKLFSFNFNKS